MKVTFGGYGEKLVTFEATERVLAGVPAMMSANGVAAPCATGKAFCGAAIGVRDGSAVVQLAGRMRLSCTGTTPVVGYQTLVGDDAGKIKTDAAGRQFLVVDVDVSIAVCGAIL